MKRLLALVPIATFAAFAWWLLPAPYQAQTEGTARITITANGKGVVQYVDRGRGAVMIKHGPLPELRMTPMTMSFPVKDRSQLANLQPMQEVEFQLSYNGEDYLITDIK